MTLDDRLPADKSLDAFLDEQLTPDEIAEFRKRLESDGDAARQVECQAEIDSWLRAAFAPPDVAADLIERKIADEAISSVPSSRRTLVAAVCAIAVMVAWAVVAWQWFGPGNLEPYFRPTALANIYRESVSRGYRPYYFCEDEERFAGTFQKRQDVPLRLASLPADRRMIGLSYAGGLSRDTTAILCLVEEKPVIVFVDRRQTDQSLATANSQPDLHIHRKELGDLVLYEVSPFEQAMLLDYLRIGPTSR